jgi:hypothetical protein
MTVFFAAQVVEMKLTLQMQGTESHVRSCITQD